MNHSQRRPRLRVTTGGKGVGSHVGSRLIADMAEVTGLSGALSVAMAPTKQRRRGHDRGDVLVDLAVMLADGGETISDLAVLAHQPALFGSVASVPTAWRALEAVDADALERIAVARAQARATAWEAGADPGFYVIDIDATLVGSHSEKEQAAPTYKRGFGFHPLMAYLDGTREALAGLLRPGNAGSGTAVDHVTVLDAALAQLPVDPCEVEVTVRSDSAGLSHVFLDACRDRHVRFVIGHRLTIDLAQIVVELPKRAWRPAVGPDGIGEREHAEVAEITGLVDLTGWPEGTRMIVRREDPHPGAQLTFTDLDGRRYQLMVTDLPGEDTGLANLPSHSFAINQAWLTCVLIAQDLLAWTQLLVLDGDLARAEPKRLRYCLLHTAGLLVKRSRQRHLRIADQWPWTDQLTAAFARVHTIPMRT